MYEYDDFEILEDSFEVWLSDGKYIIYRKVFIVVILVDDEIFRFIINGGLELEIGYIVVIIN